LLGRAAVGRGEEYCLFEVVALDAGGHEEAFDEADESGDGGPAEEQVEDAESVTAKVEVMGAEASEKEGEEDAGDFIFLAGGELEVEGGLLFFGEA
jgi:hypothetical protein